MSSALPASNKPSDMTTTTTTTIQAVFDLVTAGEYRRAGAMYSDLLDTDPDDFEPAGDDDDDEAPKKPKFPVPEMTVGQRVLWDEGFASRIAVEPWQGVGSLGLAGILQQGLFEANLDRARARPTPTFDNGKYKGKKLTDQRWVCYVRACGYSCTNKPDVGRFKGHWEHHPDLGRTDPQVWRRWSTDPWRWIEDQVENGGRAAKRAESEEEFLSFLEQALQQKQWAEEDRLKALQG